MPGDNPVLDGMKVGADGRIYVTDLVAAGIHVLAPDGEVLDFIPTGGAPSNIAFDGETLVGHQRRRARSEHRALDRRHDPEAAHPRRRRPDLQGRHPREHQTMSERAAFPGLSYKGMTCFVTGGGSGIGLETALTFADLGGDVAVLDWTPGAAAATAARNRSDRPKGLGDRGRRRRRKDCRRSLRVDQAAGSVRSTWPSPAPAFSARAAPFSRPRSPTSSRSWA